MTKECLAMHCGTFLQENYLYGLKYLIFPGAKAFFLPLYHPWAEQGKLKSSFGHQKLKLLSS